MNCCELECTQETDTPEDFFSNYIDRWVRMMYNVQFAMLTVKPSHYNDVTIFL